MKMIRFLNELIKTDTGIAGGKGASLGELINADIPVPNGFVVLTRVFDEFLAETDLTQEIKTILSSVDHNMVHTVEGASEKIQGLIKSRAMPEKIVNEIMDGLERLEAKRVAVRSSATSEDGMDHAWAGQLETYLNVSPADVADKVKACWASLFSPRALFYRFENELHGSGISVAVVVQAMIESEKSGVAFSVHPITENPNQIIIEAGYGLGETIVSGAVTPDSYVITKDDFTVIDMNVNYQTQALMYQEGAGNVWVYLDESKGKSQVLSEKDIQKLADLVVRIEAHYDFPCDIEWAFQDGAFFITQSRPITTLSGLNSEFKSKPHLQKLFAREYSVQYCESSLRSLGPKVEGHIPRAFLSQCYLPEKGNEAVYFDESEWKGFQNHLREILIQDSSIHDFLKNFHRYGKEYIEVAQSVSSGNLSELSEDELIERYESYLKILNIYTCYLWKGFYLNALISDQAFELLNGKNILASSYDEVVAALFSPSKKDGVLRLQEELSELKKDSVELSGKRLEQLLEDYAWMPCLDLHNDPWTEEQVRNYYAELEPVAEPFMTYEKAADMADLSMDERVFFDNVREFIFVKDMRDIYRRKAICFARPLFDEMAKRMGIDRHDIAYCSNEEIIAALKGELDTGKIPYQKRHKGFLIYWEGDTVVISTDSGKVDEFYGRLIRDESDDRHLTGMVASRGRVSGIAKIVEGVADLSKVEKGDILVAVTTHPDFVPAMQRAVAFVTDEGGLTSHAAIVAREMKKPCIVGTKRATQLFKDGDYIYVDAMNGVVRYNK